MITSLYWNHSKLGTILFWGITFFASTVCEMVGQTVAEVKSIDELLTPKPGSQDIIEISFSNTRLGMLLARRNGRVEQWDVATKQVTRELDLSAAATAQDIELMSADFTPDGSHVAVVATMGSKTRAFVADASTGAGFKWLPDPEGKIKALAFSPDGRWLAAAMSDGAVSLWEVAELTGNASFLRTKVLDRLPAAATHLAWSPLVTQTTGSSAGGAPAKTLLRLAVASSEGDVLSILETSALEGEELLPPLRKHLIPFLFLTSSRHENHQISWSSDARYIAVSGIWPQGIGVPSRADLRQVDMQLLIQNMIPHDGSHFGVVALDADSGAVWRCYRHDPTRLYGFAFSPREGVLQMLVRAPDSDNYATLVDFELRRQKVMRNGFQALSPVSEWHPGGAFIACSAGPEVVVVQPVHDQVTVLHRAVLPQGAATGASRRLEEMSEKERQEVQFDGVLGADLAEKRRKERAAKRAAQAPISSSGILQVIAVGIDKYRQPGEQLGACVSEAELLVEALRRSSGPLYQEVRCLILRDEQATRAGMEGAIQSAVEDLRKANASGRSTASRNTILFFYGGHGGRAVGQMASEGGSPEAGSEQQDEFYLCPVDYFGDIRSSEDLRAGALKASTVAKSIDVPEAAMCSMLVLSSCNAGGSVPWSAMAGNNTQAFFLASEPYDSVAEPLPEEQKALALKPASLFGHALVESLEVPETDADHDGFVSVREWQARCTSRTAELNAIVLKKRFYPLCFLRGADLKIAVAAGTSTGTREQTFTMLPAPVTPAEAVASLDEKHRVWQQQRLREKDALQASMAPFESATIAQPYVNTLGQKFIPLSIPSTMRMQSPDFVFACIWETRVRDYAAFVKETGYKPARPDVKVDKWERELGIKFKRRGQTPTWDAHFFRQGEDEPAVCVSWKDAEAYHVWLTKKERAAGRLPAKAFYRLPKDFEWSCAAGIAAEEEPGLLPSRRTETPEYARLAKRFPAPLSDNFFGERDGFRNTCPVGRFKPNELGFYNLLGNVEEMLEGTVTETSANPGQYYDYGMTNPLIRGGSFIDNYHMENRWKPDTSPVVLRSFYSSKEISAPNLGFRSVIVIPANP